MPWHRPVSGARPTPALPQGKPGSGRPPPGCLYGVEKKRVRFVGFLNGRQHFRQLDRQSAADIQVPLFQRLVVKLPLTRPPPPSTEVSAQYSANA